MLRLPCRCLSFLRIALMGEECQRHDTWTDGRGRRKIRRPTTQANDITRVRKLTGQRSDAFGTKAETKRLRAMDRCGLSVRERRSPWAWPPSRKKPRVRGVRGFLGS
jgi:hypothetical protein